MGIVYLTVLAGMGLLLSGAGRERWRGWAVSAVVGAGAYEVWERLNWEGLRGVGNNQGQVSMVRFFFVDFCPPSDLEIDGYEIRMICS